MLIKLSGRALRPMSDVSANAFVTRITERPDLPEAARSRETLLIRDDLATLPLGFRAYLARVPLRADGVVDAYSLSEEFDYLGDGDVVRIDPTRCAIHALYRRNSPSNSFLVTERCDNYCVMCSQPPKDKDDSWLIDELNEVIPLVSPETRELGITGGEPTLLRTRLVALLERMKSFLPRTAVHVLSNGRSFKDPELAAQIGALAHHDLMIGIPLYSDVAEEHDFVVQARGAFDETVRGILNLKRFGVRVEIRFVIHRETYASLPTFARFVTRNLLFVDHVALMGLEQMGFAKANLEDIWIDPLDYQQELAEAVATLHRAKLRVSIYNHQLCVLQSQLHQFAARSISDWKNAYIEECAKCALRKTCGGFFASSTTKRSRGIARVADS